MKNHIDRLDKIEELLQMAATQTVDNAKQIVKMCVEFNRETKEVRKEMKELRAELKNLIKRIAV